MPLRQVELIPFTEHTDVEWGTRQLTELIAAVDPATLPNARRLSEPHLPVTPIEAHPSQESRPTGYTVLLPNIGTGKDYVLRAELFENTKLSAILERATAEKGRLSAVAKEEGIGELIVPHSVLVSRNDPHVQRMRWAQTDTVVYTVVEKIGDGQNLGRAIRHPQHQRTLLALGRTLIKYIGLPNSSVHRLSDITGPSQYSHHPRLYDLGHEVTRDLEVVADGLDELLEWVPELLPSRDATALGEELSNLRTLYPKTEYQDGYFEDD